MSIAAGDDGGITRVGCATIGGAGDITGVIKGGDGVPRGPDGPDGATDGGTTDAGDAAVIPGGDRQPSGRRGPPDNEGVSTSDRYGEAA